MCPPLRSDNGMQGVRVAVFEPARLAQDVQGKEFVPAGAAEISPGRRKWYKNYQMPMAEIENEDTIAFFFDLVTFDLVFRRPISS